MSDSTQKKSSEEAGKIIPDITAYAIIKVLEASHDPVTWAFFNELRIGTGFGKDAEQRFDAWAIHYHPSKRNVTRCYEVKISRSDFRSEIRKPLKRRPGLRLANEFYFVTPENMLEPGEIPPECGLMEVGSDGKLKIKVVAPFRDVMPPTWLFTSALCRRIDAARAMEIHIKAKADAYLKMAEMATNIALDRHIRKWRNHNVGSREIPDKILDALEDLKREVAEIIKIQSKNVEYI